MEIFFFLVLGLLVGSFLNVVILRWQTEESAASGRSHCFSCKSMIAWYDNIPVLSFALLGGKCRHCKAPISWQYPLVELSTGLLFAFVGWKIFDLGNSATWLESVWMLGLIAFLTVVFVYDLLTMYIPMAMIWLSIGWTLVYRAIGEYFFLTQPFPANLLDVSMVAPTDIKPFLWAALGAFFFFWILVKVSNETWMGEGDAYLAFLVGLVTGFPGVIWTLTFAFGTGALVGIAQVILGGKGMKSQIPFAPFLTASVVIALFVTQSFSWAYGWFFWEL